MGQLSLGQIILGQSNHTRVTIDFYKKNPRHLTFWTTFTGTSQINDLLWENLKKFWIKKSILLIFWWFLHCLKKGHESFWKLGHGTKTGTVPEKTSLMVSLLFSLFDYSGFALKSCLERIERILECIRWFLDFSHSSHQFSLFKSALLFFNFIFWSSRNFHYFCFRFIFANFFNIFFHFRSYFHFIFIVMRRYSRKSFSPLIVQSLLFQKKRIALFCSYTNLKKGSWEDDFWNFCI